MSISTSSRTRMPGNLTITYIAFDPLHLRTMVQLNMVTLGGPKDHDRERHFNDEIGVRFHPRKGGENMSFFSGKERLNNLQKAYQLACAIKSVS